MKTRTHGQGGNFARIVIIYWHQEGNPPGGPGERKEPIIMMKRRQVRAYIAVLGILLAIPVMVSARGVTVGVKGGLTVPNIRGSETDIFARNFSSRQGLFFGLSLAAPLGSRFALVTELNYASQGGQRKGMQPITMDMEGLPIPPGTMLFADFRNETILNYIELPVLGRFSFGHRVRFFADAGPYVGLLVRSHAVTTGTSALYLDEGQTMPVIIPPSTDPLVVDLAADTNVGDSLRNWNAGIQGGLGLLYPMGRGDVSLEARFELGLTTIQRDVTTSGSNKTGAVVVAVGYSLPLRRR
jgi:hypothetical protein